MKKTDELVKNTAIISIGKIGTQIVNFLLLPFYTSFLPTEVYGNFDFIITIAAFIVPVMTMLMEESMFRFLIDCNNDEEKQKIISYTFIFCLFGLLVTSGIGIFIILLTNYKLGYSILLYCISMLLVSLSNALARGLGQIILYSFSNFISSICVIILNITLILFFDLKFEALLISSVTANVLASLYVFAKLKVFKYIKIKQLDKRKIINMLKFSIPLVPNSISWAVINASDRLVIMSFSGASDNGIYSVAYKFPNLIYTFFSYFNIAWRETAAKIVRDKDIDLFDKIYKIIRNCLFSITILLITMVHFIYPIFINDAYSKSIFYVPILAVSVYYSSMSAFYGGIFTAYKDTNVLGITSFTAAFINLSIDLILFKHIGVYAAAISTLASSLFMFCYRRIKIQNIFRMKYYKECYIEIGFIVVILLFYMNKNVVMLDIILFVISFIITFFMNKELIHSIFSTIKKVCKK